MTTTVLATLVALAASTSAPSGEEASYALARDRTSEAIKNGSAVLRVVDVKDGEELDGSTGRFYEMALDYVLKAGAAGIRHDVKGTTTFSLPERYFEPSFWDELATAGSYRGDGFQIRYLGARPDCKLAELSGFASKHVGDLKATICVDPTLPALGARTIDLSASLLGGSIPLRAGLDLRG